MLQPILQNVLMKAQLRAIKQSKKMNNDWVSAGTKAATDINAVIVCPNCKVGVLHIFDIEWQDDPDIVERYLVCGKCGARNIMRINKKRNNTE